MTTTVPRPAVSDAQLAILAEVEATFHHPDGYTRAEGASQAGLNRRSLQQLIAAEQPIPYVPTEHPAHVRIKRANAVDALTRGRDS